MNLYNAIFALLVLLSLTVEFKIKNKYFLFFTSFVIIVCFQGLRWRTGTDWEPYYRCFMVSNEYQVEYVEYGYYLLNKCVRCFTDSYTVFLCVESIVIYSCIWRFANYFNAFNVSFVLFSSFAGSIFPVRFTLACAVFLLAYQYIYERKFYKFLIIYILAVFIHQIVALTLPLYFISFQKYKDKFLQIVYLSSCLLGLLAEFVFGNLFNAVNAVFMYLPSFSQDKAAAYLDGQDNMRPLFQNLISWTNGYVFILFFCYVRRRFNHDDKINVLLNLYVFGLSISRIVLNTIPYLARVNSCCSGGFILMCLMFIEKQHKNKYFYLIGLSLYLYASYVSIIDEYPDLYIPYYSVFNYLERPIVY